MAKTALDTRRTRRWEEERRARETPVLDGTVVGRSNKHDRGRKKEALSSTLL